MHLHIRSLIFSRQWVHSAPPPPPALRPGHSCRTIKQDNKSGGGAFLLRFRSLLSRRFFSLVSSSSSHDFEVNRSRQATCPTAAAARRTPPAQVIARSTRAPRGPPPPPSLMRFILQGEKAVAATKIYSPTLPPPHHSPLLQTPKTRNTGERYNGSINPLPFVVIIIKSSMFSANEKGKTRRWLLLTEKSFSRSASLSVSLSRSPSLCRPGAGGLTRVP